jgi:hypothetical protein
MTRIARCLAFALIALMTLASCRSTQKMVESGDYDAAIEYCVDKLSGKKKKKTELVQGLELAFQKATDRDMRASDALKVENRPENWDRIYRIYSNIQHRQESITPLLPLTSHDGYTAKFQFVNIERLVHESRTNAAEYEYNRAQNLLAQARQGDKMAARKAFDALETIRSKYFRDYKDTEVLQREARERGIVHVVFSIENRSMSILPIGFEDRVLNIEPVAFNTFWKQYHTKAPAGVKMDYRAVWVLQSVDISPERVAERHFNEQKTIQDGWDYLYDKRGNVRKDSLGNDMKEPRYVVVNADVLEARQTKAARLGGTILISDFSTGQRLNSQTLGTEILFDHLSVTYRGDQRALSDETCRRLGSAPVPFPSDAELMAQAADRLQPDIRCFLRDCPALAMN